MAFIGIFIVIILLIISAAGILSCIGGIIFLVAYIKKNRKNIRKKGFLITAIILLAVGVPAVFAYPGTTSLMRNHSIDSHIDPQQYPVINAIQKNNTNKVKRLLKSGADPDETFDGRPAIFFACNNFENGINYEAAKMLISYNADIFAKDGEGRTLMRHILLGGIDSGDKKELLKIFGLLTANGYDMTETDSQNITLLMYAMQQSGYYSSRSMYYDISVLLTDNGADVNAVDNNGRTVLMWACGSENPNSPFDAEYDPDIPSIEGKYQFAQYDYNIIKHLIDKGADITSVDGKGYTALDYFKQAEENSKDWGDYSRLNAGQSADYINKCKMIENLLK